MEPYPEEPAREPIRKHKVELDWLFSDILRSDNPEDRLADRELAERILDRMQIIRPKYKYAFANYIGLNGEERLTIREIGSRMGLSPGRVWIMVRHCRFWVLAKCQDLFDYYPPEEENED